MKKIFEFIILPIAVIALGYWIYASIRVPLDFETERSVREKAGVERLKDIRTLQVAFKSTHGRFTSSLDTLADFYKNGKITVIKQVGSFDDSLAVAQKRVYRDSVNISVKDTILKRRGFVIDSIKYIPFAGKKEIHMTAVYKQVSGVSVPLFEAAIPFVELLNGLDQQLIINLKSEREDTDRYPGLKVGSITAPNNNAGNWE